MENQDIVGLFHVKHKRNICDLPGIYLNRIKRRMAAVTGRPFHVMKRGEYVKTVSRFKRYLYPQMSFSGYSSADFSGYERKIQYNRPFPFYWIRRGYPLLS